MGGSSKVLKLIHFSKDFLLLLCKIILIKKNYDVIIIKNYLVPVFGCGIEKLLTSMLVYKKLLFDIDDGIYFNSTRKENRIFARFRKNDKKVNYWANKSDIVLACNSILESDLAEIFSVDEGKFVTYTTYPYRHQYFNSVTEIATAKKNDKVLFVWLGSSHTQVYLALCKPFIRKLSDLIPNSEFIIIGADDVFCEFEGFTNVTMVKWSIENEVKYMRMAHFGLNPLVDSVFENRKCAFKVIQYYRAGIIPLTSKVGFNIDLIDKYGGYCTADFANDDNALKFIVNCMDNILFHSEKTYLRTRHMSVEYNATKLSKLLNV